MDLPLGSDMLLTGRSCNYSNLHQSTLLSNPQFLKWFCFSLSSSLYRISYPSFLRFAQSTAVTVSLTLGPTTFLDTLSWPSSQMPSQWPTLPPKCASLLSGSFTLKSSVGTPVFTLTWFWNDPCSSCSQILSHRGRGQSRQAIGSQDKWIWFESWSQPTAM